MIQQFQKCQLAQLTRSWRAADVTHWSGLLDATVARSRSPRVTCDDLRVDVEGVVGRVDAPFLVVLLAEGEGAAVHAHVVDVRVAAHRGLRQGQVLLTIWGEEVVAFWGGFKNLRQKWERPQKHKQWN